MGSVTDIIECPNCNNEAHDDFYYKTGEEYVFCHNCGYTRTATIINTEKKLSELTEADWKFKELKNPYGAFRIKAYNSIGTQIGSLETESDHAELLQHLSNNVDVEYASVSRFVDGEIVNEVIIDNGPEFDSAGFSTKDR